MRNPIIMNCTNFHWLLSLLLPIILNEHVYRAHGPMMQSIPNRNELKIKMKTIEAIEDWEKVNFIQNCKNICFLLQTIESFWPDSMRFAVLCAAVFFFFFFNHSEIYLFINGTRLDLLRNMWKKGSRNEVFFILYSSARIHQEALHSDRGTIDKENDEEWRREKTVAKIECF